VQRHGYKPLERGELLLRQKSKILSIVTLSECYQDVNSRNIVVTIINIVEGYICHIDRSKQSKEGVEIDSKQRCG
jgi:hypothetical protein